MSDLSITYDDGAHPSPAARAESIDRSVAEEALCDGCDREGLQLRVDRTGSTYRAWMRCPDCGAEREL